MKNFCKYINYNRCCDGSIRIFATLSPTHIPPPDDSTIPADELQLSVARRVVDGKNGNIIVENNSPILSEMGVGESVNARRMPNFRYLSPGSIPSQLPWIEFWVERHSTETSFYRG